MPPDPKPTPPDKSGDAIAVKSIAFLPGMQLPLPGAKFTKTSLNGVTEVGPGECYTIAYHPRVRAFRVAYYQPAPDLARAPTGTVMVMEHVISTWTPA